MPNPARHDHRPKEIDMRSTRTIATALAALTAAALLAAGALAGTSHPSSMHGMDMSAGKTMTAADLRVTLDNLFGEHAVLAMNATNAGVTGSKGFPAAAKALDANSVALSKAIASFYGAKAASTFLDGKYMWRDHIRFFVAYTGALAKKDKAGQAQAVKNLQQYTKTFGTFLSTATGLPKLAVENDLLGHVLELKAQLDAYAAGNYGTATAKYHAAYNHMFMTGDLVAGAIAKQKHLS
jgi:hypothetical protein